MRPSGFISRLLVLGSVVLLLLIQGTPARAHKGGRAIPSVEITTSQSGPLTLVVVAKITDADSGTPVQGANVTFEAVMVEPHEMWTLPVPMTETAEPGVYESAIKFPMAADWKFKISVAGESVLPATAEYDYRLTFQGAEELTSSISPSPARVMVQGSLGMGDVLPLTSLIFHSVASLIWVALTLLLVVAALRGGHLSPEFTERILEKGSRWRAGAIAAGVVVVITGVINTAIVAPITIAPTPDAISAAMKAPFGGLYLAILGSKIVLMAVLIVINRISPDDPAGSVRFALQVDAVLLPLLLVAVVALRYVHVLSHVAQTLA